jgi:hypothetical protein
MTGEDNADAHMKRQVMGREVVVAITNGRLDFGPWEQIFYGEFDGRRRKRVLVKIVAEWRCSSTNAGCYVCIPQLAAADIAAAPHRRLQQVWVSRPGLIQRRPHFSRRVFLATSTVL